MAPEKQARRRRGHASSTSPASAPVRLPRAEACHTRLFPRARGSFQRVCHRRKGTLQQPHRSLCSQPRQLPQGTGQPLSLRDPGEDAPRPPLPGRGVLREAAAPGGRGSPAAGTAPAVRGKTPYSPPPQESAMLGRPPSPRCPRSRRPRRPSASRGLREKGTGATAAAFTPVPGLCSRPVTARTQRCPPC